MILVYPAQLLAVPDIVARLEYGTWLLEHRLTPRYGYVGMTREGAHFVFIRYAEVLTAGVKVANPPIEASIHRVCPSLGLP